MRASEFITETQDGEFDPVYQAAIKNAVRFPDQNVSTGSAYLNYRFGIAMAGAPDYPTKAASSAGPWTPTSSSQPPPLPL